MAIAAAPEMFTTVSSIEASVETTEEEVDGANGVTAAEVTVKAAKELLSKMA